ncbi:MAG: hypothetical protein CVV64_00175 [Candidatus Wallbacteria bacterium HGW-Wallbacteria-1]|jgi:hypothetical protein|uniref:Uncharacterized protein n=1 Tax=Candidatus Wallbacteria bacterium HGW-Wallbacteria-1 TaxID=2013854 RepID=A0A2N1PU71_9BACT|nr:MAG: hypothetical protein CVV64_00175 [Candidatus Wallbacteria bacterium HGW-Wallbacteria-1]
MWISRILVSMGAISFLALGLVGCLETSPTADFNISGATVSTVRGKVKAQTATIASESIEDMPSVQERIFMAVDENGDSVNVLDFRITSEGTFTFLPKPVYDLNHYLLFNVVEHLEKEYLDTSARYLLSPQVAMNFVTASENMTNDILPLVWVNRTAQFGGGQGFGFRFNEHKIVFQEWDSDLWISYTVADPTSASVINLRGNIARDKTKWLRNISVMPYTIENTSFNLESDDKVFYLRLRDAKKWVAFQITDVIKSKVLKLVLHYTDPQTSVNFGYAGRDDR